MHPEGFHKDEAAKARCYGCSNPDMLAWDEADEAYAKQLIAEGWMSTSNAGCMVSRVVLPPISECVVFSEKTPPWMAKEMVRAWHNARRSAMRSQYAETITLTVAQFRAFRKCGGDTA